MLSLFSESRTSPFAAKLGEKRQDVGRKLGNTGALRRHLRGNGGRLDLSLEASREVMQVSLLTMPVLSGVESSTLTPSETTSFAERLSSALGIIGDDVYHLDISRNWGAFRGAHLQNLLSLNVSGVGLRHLPTDLGRDLPRLVDLVADQNFIATLPDSVAHLEHLDRLSLNNNAFFEVPPILPPYLQILLLENNAIARVPRDYLHHLQFTMVHLDLRGNHIDDLPTAFLRRCHYHNLELRLDSDVLLATMNSSQQQSSSRPARRRRGKKKNSAGTLSTPTIHVKKR